MSNREDAIVLGRKIGTYDGWDQVDDDQFVMYNFRSAFPAISDGDLTIDYSRGEFQIISDDGEVTWSADMISILQDSPREDRHGR